MRHQDFSRAITLIRDASLETLLQRNANYSRGSDDALHNFAAGAEIVGGTPAQAAWGYMTKHLVALRDKVQRDDFHDMDDLLEKCQDVINYTAIIFAIAADQEGFFDEQVRPD